MRRLWNTPLYVFALGATSGVLGMLAVPRVSLPDRIFPVWRAEAPAPAADRAPDALGASLARSVAEAGQRALGNAVNPAARAGCEAAIAEADTAAYRAAEDARGKQRNTQNVPMVLSAEDLYLAAARLCLREARPVCQATPRRTDGCDKVLAVSEAELASTRALRASRGN
ncbi:hypothetical protein [Dankookia sp. P2]|uniref:hypothetical protein n=1 Tax=Dankookia sp. P2 TaxID=3423955 RepID=UPI003D675E12